MNKRLKALLARQEALVKTMDEFLDKVGAESLTQEQEGEYAAFQNDLKGVQAGIAREKALIETERNLDRRADGNEDDERARKEREGGGVDAGSQGFETFGQMLQAVAVAGDHASGRQVDPRLRYIKPDFNAAATGMNERYGAEGGFLVDKDVVKTILERVYETGTLASQVRRIGISAGSNGLKMNAWDETSRAHGSRMGGIRAYWTPEAGQKTPSMPLLRPVEMTLKKLTGLMYATDELIQDAAALESIIVDAFAEEFGFMIDDAILNGTGVGMPLGVFKSGAAVQVAAEAGQTASTIVAANVLKMWSRLPPRSRKRAIWIGNAAVEPQLYTMTIGNQPVFLPPGGLANNPNAMLLGRPFYAMEQMPVLGAAGQLMLIDPYEYLLIDKGGIQKASSIHVRFIYDETCFRFVYRVEGTPLWNAPVTPFDASANTLAPYVYLGAVA